MPVTKTGDDFVFTVTAGDIIEANLIKPIELPMAPPIPPAPADGWAGPLPVAPFDPGVPMYPPT